MAHVQARNPKSGIPAKKLLRAAHASQPSKMPLTLRIAKPSWKKIAHESDGESEDEVLLELHKEYQAKDFLAKIYRALNLARKCFVVACRIKSRKTNLSARTGQKTAKPLNQQE